MINILPAFLLILMVGGFLAFCFLIDQMLGVRAYLKRRYIEDERVKRLVADEMKRRGAT